MANENIAVITGASRGLGLYLVQAFASKGWQVVGTGRSEQPAQLPAGASYSRFDASDADACEAFWRQLCTDNPGVTFCLINNAGGYISGGLTQTKPTDYLQQMQSCYFSAVYMTRAMALVTPSARIINIISSSALRPHKNNSAYGAAKAAEMHFFQALQQEFAPHNYRITNLYPSDIASHGDTPAAIHPADLAAFVLAQAENHDTYYLRDATLYPSSVE